MSTASRQSAFTIISPLAPEGNPLPALAQLQKAWETGRHRLLDELPELHYCSLVVVERGTSRYLAFEGNIDGESLPFWQRLEQQWGGELAAVYHSCQGFSGSLVAHLSEHDQGPGTWYVAWQGRSAREIRREELLRDRIEGFLTHSTGSQTSPEQVRADIQAFVLQDRALADWAANPPRRPFSIRWGRTLAIAIGLAAVALIVLASCWAPTRRALVAILLLLAAAVLYLRRLEKRDAQGSPFRSPEILRAVWKTEDRSLTNHMCGVTQVKDGWFRMLVVRLSLTVVGLAHRFWFNRGDLGGIPSIHFARWLIRKGNRELLFFSNFDGSWEGYLGDFIDRASIGLNSIWSNTKTYPRTSFLVLDGARDEPRFKAFGRNTMTPTRVWYSAYPTLSVQNIHANARIREGLFASLDREATEAWLRLF